MLLQFRTMRSNLLLQWIYGKEFVVKYISLTLAEVERDWTTQEKEAFAMVWAFETYRPYIIGYTFTIETDHESLVWLKNATNPLMLVRWACRSIFKLNIDQARKILMPMLYHGYQFTILTRPL